VSADVAATPSRIELELVRPRVSLHAGVRPTVVVDGRGQPAQWGVGTWQRPVEGVAFGVYLFNRLWRYGSAHIDLEPGTTRVVYVAPRTPFGRGRITATAGGRPVR
jgi:hypothetical protein